VRETPRIKTAIRCHLESSGASTDAMLVDISLGGAGIEATTVVPDAFLLSFVHQGTLYRLSCTVRHQRDLWNRRRIHAQFSSLAPAEQEQLTGLLDSLTAADAERTGRTGVVRLFQRLLHR
jgi:c-di-GMP-binding flagellar brake protein YcgR